MFMFMFLFRTMSVCIILCIYVFMYVSFQEWLMLSVVMWRQELVPHMPGGSVMVAPKHITPMVR